MNLEIESNTRVTLNFSLTLETGEEVDSNFGTKPVSFVMGDGSLLMNIMRQCHQKLPNIPLLVSTKEISMEDVRLGLEKLPDRFVEHKNTVFVISNLNLSLIHI